MVLDRDVQRITEQADDQVDDLGRVFDDVVNDRLPRFFEFDAERIEDRLNVLLRQDRVEQRDQRVSLVADHIHVAVGVLVAHVLVVLGVEGALDLVAVAVVVRVGSGRSSHGQPVEVDGETELLAADFKVRQQVRQQVVEILCLQRDGDAGRDTRMVFGDVGLDAFAAAQHFAEVDLDGDRNQLINCFNEVVHRCDQVHDDDLKVVFTDQVEEVRKDRQERIDRFVKDRVNLR